MRDKMRLLTPGPTPVPEEVRLALAQDMIHHRKPQFREIMARVQEKLKILFGTAEPVLPISASGTGAMTAAVYSLFEPGQKVLVVEGGKFGQRWVEICRSRGLECVIISVPWGEAVAPGKIEESLSNDNSIAGVLVQQSETSTGVLMPIREIAAITRKSSALLVVDGISGVGISPAPMDDWGIDCLLTGSQKGLMLPPGLALLALSDRAWRHAQAITPGCYYFNLPLERKNLEKGQTNFTSPINLLVGLDVSLDLLLKDGLEAVYRKQWALTVMIRAGVSSMGLELFVKKDFAWGVTSIAMPAGVSGSRVLNFASEKFGIVMAGGQDSLKDRIVRFGHMGWVDWCDCLGGLAALAGAVQAQGQSLNMDFYAAAMTACMDAQKQFAM